MVPDDCDVLQLPDCNSNGIPDICDIAQNPDSFDCNENGVPDECEDSDCNGNGVLDECDITDGSSSDEDMNGVPDECDCLCDNRRKPGSLLLFPSYDNRPGRVTYLTVTNTGGIPGEDAIRVEYIYRRNTDCLEYNNTKMFTGKDTLTVLSTDDNPSETRGYMYAFAKGLPLTSNYNKPIVYNHLIGQEIHIDGYEALEYGVNAVSFQGIGEQGESTDRDGDRVRDLNGIEYSGAPEEILIPRFLGQTDAFLGTVNPIQSRLILINLTGGRSFHTTLDFLIYNDNEQQFSREFEFYCWKETFLLDITLAFGNEWLSTQTDVAPNEVFGMPSQQSGWMRINGQLAQSITTSIADPAFYAVLIEVVGDAQGAADLPFERCSQENGDLLPLSIFGDTND